MEKSAVKNMRYESLLQELSHKEARIRELEDELLVKDSIIRRLTIQISHLKDVMG